MSYASEQITHLNSNMRDVLARLERVESKLNLIETCLDDIHYLYDKPDELIEVVKELKHSFDTFDEEGYDPTMHQLD